MRRFLSRTYIVVLLLLLSSFCFAKKQRLLPFLADSANNTKTAIIVCPGGSYSWLDMKTEGIGVARWLQEKGINAFVLKYRVVGVPAYIFWYRVLGVGHKYPDMLEDVEEALESLYLNADSLRIDTAKIGVMGFSAGGHLAMSSFIYNRTNYKPKFLCPVYPVVTMSEKTTHRRSRRAALGVYGQYNKQMRDSLSLEKHIPADCPPVFLINCKDDPVVKYQNSELLDSALTEKHIQHKYIQYLTGGHGFGADSVKTTAEAIRWKNEFLQWISSLNL